MNLRKTPLTSYLLAVLFFSTMGCNNQPATSKESKAAGLFSKTKISSLRVQPFSIKVTNNDVNSYIVPELLIQCLREKSNGFFAPPTPYYSSNIVYLIGDQEVGEESLFSLPTELSLSNASVWDSFKNADIKAVGKDLGCAVSLSFLVYDLRYEKIDMTAHRSTERLAAGASDSQKDMLDQLFSTSKPIASPQVSWHNIDRDKEPNALLSVTAQDIQASVDNFNLISVTYEPRFNSSGEPSVIKDSFEYNSIVTYSLDENGSTINTVKGFVWGTSDNLDNIFE